MQYLSSVNSHADNYTLSEIISCTRLTASWLKPAVISCFKSVKKWLEKRGRGILQGGRDWVTGSTPSCRCEGTECTNRGLNDRHSAGIRPLFGFFFFRLVSFLLCMQIVRFKSVLAPFAFAGVTAPHTTPFVDKTVFPAGWLCRVYHGYWHLSSPPRPPISSTTTTIITIPIPPQVFRLLLQILRLNVCIGSLIKLESSLCFECHIEPLQRLASFHLSPFSWPATWGTVKRRPGTKNSVTLATKELWLLQRPPRPHFISVTWQLNRDSEIHISSLKSAASLRIEEEKKRWNHSVRLGFHLSSHFRGIVEAVVGNVLAVFVPTGGGQEPSL